MGEPARLLDVDAAPRRVGTTKALAVIDLSACPACGSATVEESAHEDALIRHGGYGATRLTRITHCADFRHCPWNITTEVSEVRPPRMA